MGSVQIVVEVPGHPHSTTKVPLSMALIPQMLTENPAMRWCLIQGCTPGWHPAPSL